MRNKSTLKRLILGRGGTSKERGEKETFTAFHNNFSKAKGTLLSHSFWQAAAEAAPGFLTIHHSRIAPPVGRERIVTGSCTWHCHVNMRCKEGRSKKKRRRICRVFILPGFHQKAFNILVFGHVQHSCTGFSPCNPGKPLHLAQGLVIQRWVTAKDNTHKKNSPPFHPLITAQIMPASTTVD